MSRQPLERIASGNFALTAIEPLVSPIDSTLLYKDACADAAKLLGQRQDPESKAKLGSFLKVQSRKRLLQVDARRFTTAIPLEVLTPDEEELHARITVTEHFSRAKTDRPFRGDAYGAIAVKLFVVTQDNQERALHTTVSQATGSEITSYINRQPVPGEQALPHVLQLIQLTQESLK